MLEEKCDLDGHVRDSTIYFITGYKRNLTTFYRKNYANISLICCDFKDFMCKLLKDSLSSKLPFTDSVLITSFDLKKTTSIFNNKRPC